MAATYLNKLEIAKTLQLLSGQDVDDDAYLMKDMVAKIREIVKVRGARNRTDDGDRKDDRDRKDDGDRKGDRNRSDPVATSTSDPVASSTSGPAAPLLGYADTDLPTKDNFMKLAWNIGLGAVLVVSVPDAS